MAVGFRAVGNNGNAGGSSLSATITPPGGRTGDILLMCVATNTVTTISTSSTGWSQVGTTQDWAGGTKSSAVFLKVSSGGFESPTVDFGTATAYQSEMGVYLGVDQASPINDYSFSNDSDATSTSIPAPSVTTNTKTRIVVFALVPTQSVTPPSGFIERAEGTGPPHNALADAGPDYVAGTLGPWTFSTTSAQHAAWSIALKEDPARREPAWEATGANVTSTSGATSLTPSTPAAIQNDDLMLLELLLSSSSATVNSVPSGWIPVDSTFSGQARLYTYRKYYDGSIGTFGFDDTIVVRAANSRFTSPHSSTPVDSHTENSGTAGTAVIFPAVTPVGDGLLAYVGGSASAAAQTNAATTPTNATERYDASTTSASGSVHTFGGTRDNASAGVATSTFTSNLTNSADWAAQTIVLANPDVTPPAAPTGLVAEAIGV